MQLNWIFGRLFDRFYRINPGAVKANPFGVRLPAADVFNAIEELKVSFLFRDKSYYAVSHTGFSHLQRRKLFFREISFLYIKHDCGLMKHFSCLRE